MIDDINQELTSSTVTAVKVEFNTNSPLTRLV